MNIINILSYSLNDDNMSKVTTHHRVPNTDYTIQFADTHEKRLVRKRFTLLFSNESLTLFRNFSICTSSSVGHLLTKV